MAQKHLNHGTVGGDGTGENLFITFGKAEDNFNELYPAVAAVQNTANAAVPGSRSVNGHALTSDVTVTKSDVGLGSVDNTADTAKPVSTAQQTALNLKLNSLVSIKAKTASYVLGTDGADITDINAGKYVMFTMDVASSNTFTIPQNATFAAPIGAQFGVRRIGAGVTTIAVSGAASIIATATALTDPGQYITMWFEKTGTDTWLVQNGGNGTWQSFTPTFTGFSVQPASVDCTYVQLAAKLGKVQWEMASTGGTSNATTFTMTIPWLARSQRRNTLMSLNAGVNGNCEAYTAAGSNIVSFFRGASAWTASGNKGAWGTLDIEIQ